MSAATTSGVERIGAAFASRRGSAALMPYAMAGYPTLAESTRIGEACVQAGADVIELGVPYSDPLADGPVIHAAGTAALAAGATLSGVLEVARTLSEQIPVVLMCYANMVYAPGAGAFVERLARAGRRPSCSRICTRASSPITRCRSRTIAGYGAGPTAEPIT